MQVFTQIQDALALIRLPKGVYKQTPMYARGGKVYVPHSGGFIQVRSAFNDRFATSHPDVQVVEFDAPGVRVTTAGGAPELGNLHRAPGLKAV